MHRCQSYASSFAQTVYGYCAKTRFRLPLILRAQLAAAAVCLVALSTLASNASAAERARSSAQATTSDAAKREAIQSIPLKQLHKKYRRPVQQVLRDPSLYRRMPTQMVDCDPKMFTFLAENPEVLVEMWQHMGISRVALRRTGANTFSLTDNAGTTGRLVIVEQKCDDRAQNRIVMYSEGAYEGKPFKRPVRAECVLLLRSGSVKETNGRDYVACRLDTFVRIERTSIELFAKAMHPWVGKTADANFVDTIGFISNLSQAAERRPETLERLVSNLPRVTRQRQNEFAQIAYNCSEKYDDLPDTRLARKPE